MGSDVALSDAQDEAINRIRLLEKEVGRLWKTFKEAADQFDPPLDMRCMAHAKTQMQDAFMWWRRACEPQEDAFK
jgi:hypothetical protein